MHGICGVEVEDAKQFLSSTLLNNKPIFKLSKQSTSCLSFMESKGYRKPNLNHKSYMIYCLLSLFLFPVCLFLSTATTWQQDIRFLLFAEAADTICSQEISQKTEVGIGVGIRVPPLNMARRLLSGPGSSPPRCISKCGNCTPCTPVHVSVPPGTPVTAEYYPEAWRCKCGNKLYMP